MEKKQLKITSLVIIGAFMLLLMLLGCSQPQSEIIKHASDRQWSDHFGSSVSISGNYLVVGAFEEDGGVSDPAKDAGAAYIYERDGSGNWSEVKILHASDMQAGDIFGCSVSISDNYLVVGAKYEHGGTGDPARYAGAAYIYERDGSGNWREVQILHASDMQKYDWFGSSVSINGNYLVVGAKYENGGTGDPANDAGAAYIYERDGSGNWREVRILHASDMQAGDVFGWSVSISGNYLVVGAECEDGGLGDPAEDAGAAYIYERDGFGNWNEVKILHASDMQVGDLFGISVSISDNYLVVGAWGEDGGAGDPAKYAGAAYIYERDGSGNWSEVKILHASDMQKHDLFGWSVSINGNYLVVGADGEAGGVGDPAKDAGAAYIYERDDGGNWNEAPILHASDIQAGDYFGGSVSISGNYLVVGAVGENGGTGDPAKGAGAAYIYYY